MSTWNGRWRFPLYLRIWLAVVLAVALITIGFGTLWRMNAEQQQQQQPPTREIVIRNEEGDIIGHSRVQPQRLANRGVEFEMEMKDGSTLTVHFPPRDRPAMERRVRSWLPRSSEGFLWLLGIMAVAVALGSYPVVRRLTQRLETVRLGVERWGAGDLGVRVEEDGNDEVAVLARRFNQAAERVETLVKSHKSLLANASHELRSPLARIRMGLELMGPETSQRSRDEIQRNIAELDQLIDEILLASRLDARESDVGTVETVDLLGLAAEEASRAEAELVMLDGLQELDVQGVAKLLRRVIRNLLENARRYSQGPVQLELAREGGQAVVRVRDRGPGVPPAQRERIFEPFYRLPGASERAGGVGLGLALVRSITQRHHGSVHCEDNPGGGACFVLRLPT